MKRRFAMTVEEGDVADFNRRFFDILDTLRRDVQVNGLALSQEKCDKYLDKLRLIGRAAFSKVIGSEAASFIADFEARQREQFNRETTLTVTTPASFPLLWELLYAGPVKGKADPLQFWGFRFPVGRLYWDIGGQDDIAIQSGVFSAIHGALKHSPVEVEHLAQQLLQLCASLGIELSLERLDHWSPDDAITITQLIEWFQSDEFRYGIVHFACHCDNPEAAGASESYLRFTARQQNLELSLAELMARREAGFANEPLVFINACDSATLGHLLQTLSFPSEFLGFGAGGVIATACIMPDNFAAAFSAQFYKRLLDQQKLERDWVDVGEALYDTRLYFLENFKNPLGLGYNLYASSYQKLWITG
jgi:hypothetical protein